MIEAAAKRAVEETLTILGIDVRDPIKAQRNFHELQHMREIYMDKEFEADLLHLRRWRMAMSDIQTKGLLAAMSLGITGLATLLVLGIKEWFERGGGGP